MGRHGEYIRKRVDARWEGRYGTYSEEKRRKVYHSVYGKSYEEVKQKLATLKNFQENSLQSSKKEKGVNILFGTVAGEWLEDIKSRKKPSTYVKYRVVYNTHMEEKFGGMALSCITEKLVRERLSDILSDSIQGSVYCILGQILKFAAQKHSLILSDIKKPASGIRGKQIEVFTKTDLAKLLTVLYQQMDSYKMAVLLCLSTGIRLGELCALKWTDIDAENKILSVNRTVQRLYVEGQKHRTTLVETEPKSGHSRREIPLQDNMLKLVMDSRIGSGEYIFGGNKSLEPRTMQNHFKKILEEAEIPHKNFHILRHTYATNCIEGGADVKSLSEMLGHSSVQITMNRYVHPSMDTKRKYADRLYQFYGQICGQAS